jgi:polyisoprenoid-binding protein YceI
MRTRFAFAAPMLLSLALFACDNKDSAAPAATTGPAATTTTASATAAPATSASYAIDATGSKIEWTGAKITGHHDGSFGKFTGTVDVPAGKPEGAKIHIEIDTSSITTDQEKLVTHLKSPDFFDVAKFPTATFDSTAIAAGGAAGATHTITGNLTLHGVTKSISFPATVTVDPSKVSAKATFTISRKDFGVVYPGMPNDLIKDDVSVKLTIEAAKKS